MLGLRKILSTTLALSVAGLAPKAFALAPAAKPAKCEENANVLVVNMLYGSEKENWINEVTATFNAQRNKIGTKTLCVNTYTDGSGVIVAEAKSAAEAAASGKPFASSKDKYKNIVFWDMVSPASDIYLNKANSEYKKTAKTDLFLNPTFLVSSPVVIAMWENVAKSFGYPTKDITWADIMKRSQEDANFKFGHTNPRSSNSGLSAMIAQFYAASNSKGKKLAVLNTPDVLDAKNQEFVKAIQRSMVHYGESTGFYAQTLLASGPSYLSAAVLYENLVIESLDKVNPQFGRLIAIMPKDGTYNSNHPIAVVNGISTERRAASEKYIKFLTEKNQQIAAMRRGLRPVSDDDIKLDRTFDDAYGAAKLKDINFLATPNNDTINAILLAWSSEVKKPSHLAIVFDKSGSMSNGGRIVNARLAAIQAVRSLTQKDWVSVYQFSSDTELIATNLGRVNAAPVQSGGLMSIFSSNSAPKVEETFAGPVRPLTEAVKNEISSRIEQIGPGGGTMIKESLLIAAQHLCQARSDKSPRIRAIILLTDGEDDSGMDLSRFLQTITSQTIDGRPCNIPVFSVAYEAPREAEALLKTISERTKGAAFKGDKNTISELLSKLADFM